MKKFRILALIMTCAILLSSIMIPVSAEDPTPDPTYPIAEDVSNKTVVIDGKMGADEGWGAPMIYTTENTSGLNAAAGTGTTDNTPSTIRISTDGEYMYIFYQTSHTDFINNGWVNANGYKASSLRFFFAPEGESLEEQEANNQEGFYLNLRICSSGDSWESHNYVANALKTTGTFSWDHWVYYMTPVCYCKDGSGACAYATGDTGHAGSDDRMYSRSLVQQLGYRNSGYFPDSTCRYDQSILDNTYIAMSVVTANAGTAPYYLDKTYASMSVEIAFPISKALSDQLQNGTANYRIGAYEVVNKKPDGTPSLDWGYTTGNVLNQDGKFTAECGTTFTFPQLNTTTPTANNVTGKTITVDGDMGADEGWSVAPMLQTTYSVNENNPILAGYQRTQDTDPSTLRFSTDGEKLYVYYEITHADVLNAHWVALNPSGATTAEKKYQTPGIYFFLAPDGTNRYNLKEGEMFSISFSLLPEARNTFDENGYWKFDPSTRDNGSGKLKDDYNQFLWRMYSDNDNTRTPYSVEYLKNNVEIAAHNTGDKLSIEMSFKLTDNIKTRMANEEVEYRVWSHERTVYYNNGTNKVVAENGGYMLDASGMIATSWNDKYNMSGVKFALNSKTAVELAGFQSRVNNDGTYDVRFVSVVENYEGFTLENSKLGYLFNNGIKDSKQFCTKVYTELQAGNTTIKASDFGGKYFFCFTITGLSQTAGAYTFDVKCFTQETATAAVEYCDKPVKVTVTYAEGKVNFS